MAHHMQRRDLLRGALATSILFGLPLRLRAQGWEAALAAVAQAVGILDSLNKAKNERELRRQLKEINHKLDLLLIGQQKILDEIQRLKLFISEALFRQFRDSTAITLTSLRDRFNAVRAVEYRRSRRDEYLRLSEDIQDTTNSLGQYDFGTFYSFSLGVGMTLLLRRVIRTPEPEVRAIKVGYKNKLDAWLLPTNDRGVIRAIELAKAETSAAKTQINAYPRRFEINSKWRDEDQRCRWVNYLIISGDLDKGFSGSIETRKEDCRRIPDGECKHCKRDAVSPADTLFFDGGEAAEEPGPDYSGIPQPINTDSGYPQVQELNRLRNIVIERLRRERELAYVQSLIERASAILGSE